MSQVQALRAMFVPEVTPELRALPLGRGRWHVLSGDGRHRMLLPVGDYRFQARCLSYFVPDGMSALRARAMLCANHLMPQLALLPEFRIEEGPHGFLSRQTSPGRPAYSAVQLGTRGPFQKASVLLVSELGDGLAYAKIAAAADADGQIARETSWLRELEATSELERQVPRLLAEGRASSGRRYLVTTLAPGSRTTRAFTSGHAVFLAALGRVRREVMNFAASPCLGRLESDAAGLGPEAMATERAMLRAALHDCRVLLGDWAGPFVIAHGDFVPWNIRVRGERIFVFDWEQARAGSNPLYDALNFRVMQRAVCRRPFDAGFLVRTLRYADSAAHLLYPEWTWRARAVSGLVLAYLLDVVLQHASAGRGDARGFGREVIASYRRAVAERSQWMAT